MDQELLRIINNYRRIRPLYTPVFVKDELYYEWETKRSFKNQKIRLDLFPQNFNNESILDVGTNSGFFALYLRKYFNAGLCVGVDIDKELQPMWDRILELENVDKLHYKAVSDKTAIEIEFDNILLLSIANMDDEGLYVGKVHYNGLKFLLNKYSKISKKSLYVEPTNHHNWDKSKLIAEYQKYLSKWGEPTFLGHTDYQDRPMFRVDV